MHMISNFVTKENVLLFFVSFFSISCNSQSLQLAEANKEYRENVSKFDENFVEHFPSEINSLPFKMLISEDRSSSHPRFWIKLSYSKEELDSLKESLEIKSQAVYAADDSCLLIVDKHLTEDNAWDFDKTLRVGPEVENLNMDCHEDKLPVPKFWTSNFIESKNTISGLTKEHELFILEAKSGIFMDEKKLPNGKYTPKGWKHGYSRGVAINEKNGIVIFWFDIW